MACAIGPELIFTVFLEGDKAQRTTGFGYQRRETRRSKHSLLCRKLCRKMKAQKWSMTGSPAEARGQGAVSPLQLASPGVP